jgi:serine/threonine-protein kinase
MGSVPPLSMFEPGHRLDRYELLCKIGQGGMAIVWLARQHGKHGFEKLVAIKTVLPEHAMDLAFRAQLLDEARIAAAIDHPNVARILDVGEDRDIPFLVMEYIGGESLNRLRKTLLRRSELVPANIVLRVLADACAGLHAAHELRDEDGTPLGLVHRDVSPQNILCTENGVAKLIDFGVAKAAGRLATETATGIIKGKVPYMAPEQALVKTIDRRADVWAVGSVAYSLLANAYPFDGPNDAARLVRALSGEPPPPLPPTVPAPVAAVVFRALEFLEDDRFQTAEELRLAFERAMIDSQRVATNGDVARFFAENLVESALTRKTMIDRAIAAASDRERARELLDPPPPSVDATGPHFPSDLSGPRPIPLPAHRPLPAAPPKRSHTVLITLFVCLGVFGLVVIAFVVGSITSSRRRLEANVATASAAPESPAPSVEPPPKEPEPFVSTVAAVTSTPPVVSASVKPPSRRAPAKRNPTKKPDDDTIF